MCLIDTYFIVFYILYSRFGYERRFMTDRLGSVFCLSAKENLEMLQTGTGRENIRAGQT